MSHLRHENFNTAYSSKYSIFYVNLIQDNSYSTNLPPLGVADYPWNSM